MMADNQEKQTIENVPQKASRLFSVDALRGLIILFMALDHANLFVGQNHAASEIWDGVYPVYYDALAFLTRLVTHLAAPGFFFLMGIGMLLFAHSRRERGWSRWTVVRHFLLRGAVLIALQLLVVNRAWELSPTGWELDIYIGVLFALGGTMILGSLLLWLRPAYLLALTLALFVGIECMHPGLGMWNTIQHDPVNVILLRPGGDTRLWSYYPVLPWLELVTFGLVFGHWLRTDPKRAFSRAWKIGIACLLAFVVVRYLDGFGNIRPRMSNSWIDFLNPVKYPPSMAFTLMTMGANLILLSAFSKAREGAQRFLQPLAVFGRAPLFFYILHLFLYAGIGYLLASDGTSVPLMYPLWLLGLLVLFPLCLWYGQFKHRQSPGSILRFL
jgi:uncharacterized membrane protein